MSTFDPTEPAVLHDRKEHRICAWTGEHAADYERSSVLREDDSVERQGKGL